MKKGFKLGLHLDRLEVCYIASSEIVDGLENTKFWVRDGYRLRLLENESDNVESVLKVDVVDPESETGYKDYARIRVGNRFEKDTDSFRYCWLRLENSVLYQPPHELSYIYWIEEDMGLEFNNFSDIELAMDSNQNFFKRVKSAVRDKELTPIVLGKAYPETGEIIPSLKYLHTGDRVRYRTDTLIVKSQDNTLALELYDKGREIEESGKDYIRESFGGSSGLFRAEVKLRNRALQDFCRKYGTTQEDIYRSITDKGILFELWLFYSDKLLRFVDGSRRKVSLLQL